jgi:hypothetical protein
MITAGDRAVVLWCYNWAVGHVRGVDGMRVRAGRVAESSGIRRAEVVRAEVTRARVDATRSKRRTRSTAQRGPCVPLLRSAVPTMSRVDIWVEAPGVRRLGVATDHRSGRPGEPPWSFPRR